MHQLFLQVTKEGAKDTEETFNNMLDDIDMLVENVSETYYNYDLTKGKF